MDSFLPTPQDSIIWSEEFMGTGIGDINNGPFAGWTTIQNRTLRRNVGGHGHLFNRSSLKNFLSFTDINQLLAPSMASPVCFLRQLKSKYTFKNCSIHRVNGNELEWTHGNRVFNLLQLIHSV
jgi:hypothetical protein